MTSDHEPIEPTAPVLRPAPSIDDDDVARLVREVAAGWVMPPVRLDQPAWRERIRTPRDRRLQSLKGWFGRLGQAATAAVALTVVAAIVAVGLTGSRPGASPTPSTAGPRATPWAAASPMPKRFLTGALPSPSRLVVQLEQGNYSIVDLASGTIGQAFAKGTWGSQVRRSPNGDLVCLCTSTDGYEQGSFTHAIVNLVRFDASGKELSRAPVLDVTGRPDPRDGQVPEQPGHVSTWTTFSPDGGTAYVGWSARVHPTFTSGLVVVDLGSSAILQRLALPDVNDGTGDSRTYVDAPRVVGTASDRVVIDRAWYSWSPVGSSSPNYHFASDVYTATVDGGPLGALVPLPLGSECGNGVTLAGGLADGGIWLSCTHNDPPALTIIRRVTAAGALAGDTPVASSPVEGSTAVVSPDGAFLFLWNPIGLTLTRIELETGQVTTGQAPKPAARVDPLAAIGRWLAPVAAAKVFLQAGIVLSPDGSRVYVLGVTDNPDDPGFSGSAGLFVFDSRSLAPLGRWAPTADFVSIGISPDGSSVYAAGAPQIDAPAGPTNQPASVTVFDASTGSIRLIAGDLGSQTVSFVESTLR